MFGKKIDKTKMVKAITQLRLMENKLRMIEDRLQNSIDSKMNELLKYNQLYGVDAAKMIAGEIAEQKKVLFNIRNMRTSVERVRIRFETVMDLNGSVEMLKDVVPLVNDLKKSIVKAYPDLSIMFNDFEEKLNQIGLEIDSSELLNNPQIPMSEGMNEDVEAILKEAEEVAKTREKNRLPSPP
ncbi:hypothetical protein [Fervidicoccus fontis]|uniref:Uncharacterized protein n=1 Tax=Fervidicoccus fontis TaxID=683846 RepID=A0A2J6N583_9CREN|nr:hypothetical protein [Fervidicoccus fontis]PMB75770.1 MAG: hypothetical protein C0188_01520 [Fervidicoccus fontis]PMB76489.1 MAG: hypothetical protein C0177_05760 [Fervidicoccus fontis]HEW63450.1 hypothetical protein [Fervidicoccus fontis]